MRVFEDVPVPGGDSVPLLLVTTSPQVDRQELNRGLWVFDVSRDADSNRKVGDLCCALS